MSNARSNDEEPGSAAGESRAAVHGRILIVDDDATATRILRSMLEIDGHEVEEVNTTTGLLERIGQNPPDLLLLDLNMPGRSGMQIVEDLGGLVGTSLMVVVLTGDGRDATIGELLRRGASGFLIKPVRMNDLRTCVSLTLRLGQVQRQSEQLRSDLARAESQIASLKRDVD